MKVVITGGEGFLGRRLAALLLRRGTLNGPDGAAEGIEQITRVDTAPPPGGASDPRLRSVIGDIADTAVLQRAIDRDTSSIFHLAAVVSGMAEADFDLGMRVNLDATRRLLDVCRSSGARPRLVFASSVAVYGGDLPETVLDTTAVSPQSSYGTQKAIAELLIADCTRRGCCRRPRAAAADRQRASREAQRRRFLVRQRDCARAAERSRGGVPGRSWHPRLAAFPRDRDRVPRCRPRHSRRGLRIEPHGQRARTLDDSRRNGRGAPSCRRRGGRAAGALGTRPARRTDRRHVARRLGHHTGARRSGFPATRVLTR